MIVHIWLRNLPQLSFGFAKIDFVAAMHLNAEFESLGCVVAVAAGVDVDQISRKYLHRS